MPPHSPIPKALTFAGSDSGGGAGIQADLKTFAAFGVHGSCVVTALTAQNSLGVAGVWTPPPEFVIEQIRAIMTDIGADAAKIGMVAKREIVLAVARALEQWPIPKLVVDPVLISSSGRTLLEPDALPDFREHLLKKAFLLTPNLAEAEILTGMSVKNETEMRQATERLVKMGARAVLVKGGHLDFADESPDVLFDGGHFEIFRRRRIASKKTHGTGCVLSAAITALLAKGRDLIPAIAEAKDFVSRAIESSYPIGVGREVLGQGMFHSLE